MHTAIIRPNLLQRTFMDKSFNICAAIVDIDNTITNDKQRAKYREAQNWPVYQKLCLTDTINTKIVDSIIDCGYDFIWLSSGREFDYLFPTLEKMPLRFKSIVVGATMRNYGDFSSNLDIKKNGYEVFKFMVNNYADESIKHQIILDIWDDNEEVLNRVNSSFSINEYMKGTIIKLNYKHLVINNHDFLATIVV